MLVEMPDMGLNSLIPPSELDPRAADKYSQNIIYQYGLLQTPTGFAKVDLSSGLNSGDKVLAVFPYKEADGFDHTIAVTTEKIYRHDVVNSEWDDLTQSGLTMASDIWHPISYATVFHNDTNIYLDDNTSRPLCYHHLVVCDGGMTNIQRWAGRYEADFADLLCTADDYHSGTTHRALQVGTHMNRLLLISPQNYSSTSKAWTENNSRVRWPTIGKLEQGWAATSTNGAGFADLIETNDINVWSSLLGSQYIVYQTHTIWVLNYVGGTTVFSPLPVIKDLGLLSHHLLVSHSNSHFFVGSDYNVYQYYGGTVKMEIGSEIQKNLRDDLDPDYISRCWMVMGPKADFLWIFIVPTDSTYITKAYGRNMKTGAWSVRDLTNKWGSGGITAVNLIGGQSYTVGETYNTALTTNLSPYDATSTSATDVTTIGDVTERYGDVLYDSTGQIIDVSTWDISESECPTLCSFSEGGLFFCFTTRTSDPTVLLWSDDTDNWTSDADWSEYSGHIIRVDDGSVGTNMQYGTHYYTLTDVCSEADVAGFSVRVYLLPSDTTGLAMADDSGNVPALDGSNTVVVFDPSGETYLQELEERQTDDQITYGDSAGYIYQDSADLTANTDGDDDLCIHYTPVFDLDKPDIWKRWPGIAIVAKGSSINVQYRTDNFDTSETGWTNIS